MKNEKVILLLLSGGRDSLRAIPMLQNMGYKVKAMCIDGIQGKEKIGAIKAAETYQVPLVVKSISFFDEETWNPLKLIFRDLAMGYLAIREAKRLKAIGIATGVKRVDLSHPELQWLRTFLRAAEVVLNLFKLQLLFPVWNSESESR